MLSFKSAFVAAAAAGAMLAATSAGATTTVTIGNISAEWTSVTGGKSVTGVGTASQHPKLRWGTPKNNQNLKSGYNFDVLSPGSWNLTVDTPYDSDPFNIGTFTHLNNTISGGTGIKGAQLKVTADVNVAGVANTYSFVFDFTHNETSNSGKAKNCPYGGIAINTPPCADRVTVNFNSVSDHFAIDGVEYTLNLAGFMADGSPATEFLSKEGGSNSATIVAQVTALSNVIPGDPTGAVPEPATWAMLVAGFGLVGLGVRRRSKHHAEMAA